MAGQLYHPYLDGLRAVAVIFVMVFHTELNLLPGGFIGVDVFFVLSGYLITNQLVIEIKNGGFRFRDFYLRRIRRLMPAYTLVSVSSLVAGYFLLLPKDLVAHAKLAGLAFLSVGNFYIENTTGGYFAAESSEIPLLHTWSLSVEEQFYLIWPALLILLFKLRTQLARTNLLLIGLICCLWWSQYQAMEDPSAAYYLLPARFAELLVGACLVMVVGRLPQPGAGVAGGLQMMGLAVISGGALWYSAATVFPGFNALVVCVSTGLLIYGGSTPSWVSSILSIRPMVLVGQLSYSLYLWHWPVFAFWRYLEGVLNLFQIFCALLLSFLLAVLSWQLVEKPIRYGWKRSFAPTFGYLYVLPFLLILILFLVIDKSDGLPQRFSDRPAGIEALESRPDSFRQHCEPDQSSECNNILLVGDSHAEHFGPFIHALGNPDDGLFLTSEGSGFCPPLLGLVPVEVKSEGHVLVNKECEEKNRRLFDDLSEYKYVVLAAYWALPQIKPGKSFYTDSPNGELSLEVSMRVLRDSMYTTVMRIVDQGSTPVIIKDNPTITRRVLKCSYKRALYGHSETPCRIDRSALDDQRKLVDPIFAELSAAYPQLLFIDPADDLCDQNYCSAMIGELPVYRDRDHLNALGSQLLGERYRDSKGSPFDGDSAK